MRYWTLAAISALTAFTLFTLAGSFVARTAAAALAFRVARRSPAARARLLFRLRILPGVCAVTAGFVIALPIFLWFEEAGTTERVSRTLGLAAVTGAGLMLASAWRAAAAWRATARILADWKRRARPLDGFETPYPACAIEDEFPIVAVVGIRRPMLFVAERVLRECERPEVAAMIAHECAHVSASDNLKRLLIRACPSLVSLRRLDRAWSAAAEEAADALAAGLDARARLDMAGALIHIARLATPKAPPLASAFYLGGSIDDRVRRLVEPCEDGPSSRWPAVALLGALVLVASAIVIAAPDLHAMMEEAVRFLP